MKAELARATVTEGLNRAVMADHLRNLLAHYEIDRVLDVGAWVGGFGSMLRGIGYEGQIVSFEPVPDSHAELEAVAAADERWQVHRLALGEHDGQAEIAVAAGRDLSSLLPANDLGRRLGGERMSTEARETVELRRLDSVWEELVPRGEGGLLLKVDTQGYDWQVLEGAGERLTEASVLQLEAPVQQIYEGMTGWTELAARLEQRGFEASGVFPVTRDARLRLIEVDLVLVRAANSPKRL